MDKTKLQKEEVIIASRFERVGFIFATDNTE